MLKALPGWVQDNISAVRDEAEGYRDMPIERRWHELRSACRAAARQLAARPDGARLRAYRDPLPPSTTEALNRLSRRARNR